MLPGEDPSLPLQLWLARRGRAINFAPTAAAVASAHPRMEQGASSDDDARSTASAAAPAAAAGAVGAGGVGVAEAAAAGAARRFGPVVGPGRRGSGTSCTVCFAAKSRCKLGGGKGGWWCVQCDT